ncbi:hypothetical protein D3C87_1702340 [compost metagenome]
MHGIRRRHAEGAGNNDLRPVDVVNDDAPVRFILESDDHVGNGLAGRRAERIGQTACVHLALLDEGLRPKHVALGIVVTDGIGGALDRVNRVVQL